MKLNKFFFAMAAAAVAFASCDKPSNNDGEFTETAPEFTSEVADIVVTEATLNDKVTFTCSPADFGVNTQINYALEVQLGEGPKAVVATSTTTTIETTLEKLNYELYVRLGIATGEPVDVNFYISAQMGESAKLYSQVKTAKVTAIEAGALKSEWGIIGSMAACNNWSNDIQMFEGDNGYIYALNVALNEGDKFKFRKGGSWDTKIELSYNGILMPNAEYAGAHGGDITMGKSGVYDVYILIDVEAQEGTTGKIYVMDAGKTPDQAGEPEVVLLDYTDCQLELVGDAVSEQTGAVADPSSWVWGNVLLASNNGKPAVSDKVYTWTWANVSLLASPAGFKVRTVNADVSGNIGGFDLGADKIDTNASVSGVSTEGNIAVPAAGNYNITLVIDVEADTKVITIVAAN